MISENGMVHQFQFTFSRTHGVFSLQGCSMANSTGPPNGTRGVPQTRPRRPVTLSDVHAANIIRNRKKVIISHMHTYSYTYIHITYIYVY